MRTRVLIAALTACLFAGDALAVDPARVAVLIQSPKPNGGNGSSSSIAMFGCYARQVERNRRLELQIMQHLGINYTPINTWTAIKTTEAQYGLMSPTPGAAKVQYDGVVIPSYGSGGTRVMYGTSAGWTPSNVAPTFRPDSLSRSARGGWQKPMLAIIDNSLIFAAERVFDNGKNSSGRISDSVGVANAEPDSNVTNPDKLDNHGYPAAYSFIGNTSKPWLCEPWNNGYHRNPTPPAGGFRPLLGKMVPAVSVRAFSDGRNAISVDSALFAPTIDTDTVVVWERPWSHMAGAKPVTYVDWMGNGAQTDSVTDTNSMFQPVCEGAVPTLLFALAHYDSVIYADCGKRLITKPIQFAVVIEGGLSRGLRRWIRGVAPSDTSVFYASLDSLASDQIPVTWAVNPESAAAYPRDVYWMKKNQSARFTPQVWDGVDRADGNIGMLAAGHAHDVWGRRNPRTIVGDSAFTRPTTSMTIADSSVVAMLRQAQARCDSVFGYDRRSAFIVAPDDDWSPKGATQAQIDSILYAVKKLGYRGIVADGQRLAANIHCAAPRAEGDTIGWYNGQRKYGVRDVATGAPWGTTNILTHAGFSVGAGVRQYPVSTDTSTYGYSGLHVDLARAWDSVCGATTFPDHDVWYYDFNTGELNGYMRPEDVGVRLRNEDRLPEGWPKKAFIVRLNASGFSGDPNNPARQSLWVLRSIYRAVQDINHAAGRTIVEMTYPENVEPR